MTERETARRNKLKRRRKKSNGRPISSAEQCSPPLPPPTPPHHSPTCPTHHPNPQPMTTTTHSPQMAQRLTDLESAKLSPHHHCASCHQVPTTTPTTTVNTSTSNNKSTTPANMLPTTGQRAHGETPASAARCLHHQSRFAISPLTSVIFVILVASCAQLVTISLASAHQLNEQPAAFNGSLHQHQLAGALSQRQLLAKQHIQATFSTPNQAVNITHVTYDPLYDTVYLGATNTIYQLDGSDLSVQHEQSTGPVLDNPSCGITECHSFEDFMKPTQNVNKILVVDYQHRKLLSCGSVKQGACRRYQLNNIAQEDDLIPMAVAANDDNSSTYAFIAPARYVYDPSSSPARTTGAGNNSNLQQQVLYVASTYTKVGQSRELLVPAIGTRTLEDGPNLLKLYENSFLDSARIDINSHLRDYFLVNYLYGFASSNYIYFVTVQKKATSRDFEELGYHTRIARICITDSSYNSYTEVDLKCMPNARKNSNQQPAAGSHQSSKHSSFFSGQQQQTSTNDAPNEYPILQDAILVDAGSQLLQSLAQNDQIGSSSSASGSFFFNQPTSGSSPDDNKVLLGVFSSARDHTQHAGDHSALCAFSLAQIEDKFNDNIHSCYTGKMQSRNMEYIAGNVQECPKSGQGGNVVNFCHETLKINGTIPIVSEASIQFFNTTLTAITATSHINSQAKNIYSEQLANELSINSTLSSSSKNSIPASLFNSIQNDAVSSSSLRQHTVAFVGTSNGHIKKILLNNASHALEFEDLQLDTQPILGDLHLHASGAHLIAATPYKVFKVAAQQCGQYANCRECSQSRNPYCGWCALRKSCTTKADCAASSSSAAAAAATAAAEPALARPGPLDLILGLAGQQPAAPANNRQPAKWISSGESATGKCIELQAIVPDRIPMTSTAKIDLYIDRLPRLPAGRSYRCVFNGTEQTVAAPTSFGLTCPLPKLMDRQRHIQIEPGRDHAIVELAVRSSETNTDFLDGKLTFFECQLHTTCKDCLTTSWGCNWCLNENVCLFNTSKCDRSPAHQQAPPASGPILVGSGSTPGQQRGSTVVTTGPQAAGQPQRAGNTINQVQQCPTFDVGHRQDILIADGSERELSIRVKNMPQFKGAIKCIVEIESYKISLKARIQEDRVVCESSTYSYAADVGLLNGQLQVIYSESNIFIDRTNLTLYKCHQLGSHLTRPDCSLCQRIDSRFQCAWCSGSCHHSSRCTERPDDTCPAPRIDLVQPLAGPALGGTRVTIEGSNLGQSFEEIAGRVSIGQVPCRPVEDEYRPSNRIVCITSPVLAARPGAKQPAAGPRAAELQPELAGYAANSVDLIAADVIVGNKAGYTVGSSKFLYKSIHLRDHQPRYGPQSGGTRLTLSGLNLNIGSSVQVFLDELPCLIETSLLTSEQIVCRTSPSRQASRSIKHLRLLIDDAQIVRDDPDDVFYYTADPVIIKASPLRAYLSGGRPINVYGANLTAVQQPRMAIHDVTTGKRINESACILQDEQRMQCPSPVVNLAMMDLEYSEQHLAAQYEPHTFASSANWIQQPLAPTGPGPKLQANQLLQHDESVRFRLSFIMDNVQQTSYPSLNLEIAYTSDPRLFAFASMQYKSMQEFEASSSANLMVNVDQEQLAGQAAAPADQFYQIDADTYLLQPSEPVLVLYGEHLRAAVSEYEITVTVGQDLCNLTQLTHSKLVCLMPLDHVATPTDEEGHQTERLLPLVVVRIGFNLRYELGFVQYHPLLLQQIANSSGFQANSLHINPTYTQYLPRQLNEGLAHRLTSYAASILSLILYTTLGAVLLVTLYSGLFLLLGCAAGRSSASSLSKCSSLSAHSSLSPFAMPMSWPARLGLGRLLGKRACLDHEYRRIQAKVDSLKKSVKNECRIASLALQGDLQELSRHVELTGVPLLSTRHYIMKVFFPGMNNHPLLFKAGHTSSSSNLNYLDQGPQQLQLQMQLLNSNLLNQHLAAPVPSRPTADFPMEHFERLVLTKPFLVAFINTLERQPNFTIRDRVNVASLIMVILLERLDYATDILKTLLFQLVERSLGEASAVAQATGELHEQSDLELGAGNGSLGAYASVDQYQHMASRTLGSKLTRRASNLLSGLPISKRQSVAASNRSANLGKLVNGSANSLMASTSVAAQMLLSRVNGHKTSPWQQRSPQDEASNVAYSQQPPISAIYQQANNHLEQHQQHLTPSSVAAAGTISPDFMSTTTFNQANYAANQCNTLAANRLAHATARPRQPARRAAMTLGARHSGSSSGSSSARRGSIMRRSRRQHQQLAKDQVHQMLRRTDTIVEKMLTNWLALSLHEHFQTQMGQSLYLLFEALKCQLERGPIDCISGDAYYSLNEQKLLREPQIHFEMVNLYVIVDASILQSTQYSATQNQHQQQLIATEPSPQIAYGDLQQRQPNSITLALRVLDCDTISQVKGKILSALYKNAPYSNRLGVHEVELALRQQSAVSMSQLASTLGHNTNQVVLIDLHDEDSGSSISFNGSKRINTLRHYGITDHGIMMLSKGCPAAGQPAQGGPGQRQRANLADVLDEHYNNPYSEIQYGPMVSANSVHCANLGPRAAPSQVADRGASKSWHLIGDVRPDEQPTGSRRPFSGANQLLTDSSQSSPSSNSPSMMLLGNESHLIHQEHHHQSTGASKQQQQQQAYYHPSSSSTSSTGHVMDTNSTSINSSSVLNVSNLIAAANQSRHHHQQHHHHHHQQQQQQQPIYCQIGSVSAQSQQAAGGGSNYYCQIGASQQQANVASLQRQNQMSINYNHTNSAHQQRATQFDEPASRAKCHTSLDEEQESHIYLTRMLTSKGTIQRYIDHFFKTILSAKTPTPPQAQLHNQANSLIYQHQEPIYEEAANLGTILCGPQAPTSTAARRGQNFGQAGCPPAIKWLFDLLDEAAQRFGISDPNVVHDWKSNAFLLRFWVNFIKNPNYILDVEKSNTLDASLSIIAQTLMDSCASDRNPNNKKPLNNNKLLFSKDIPKYKELVKRFYQDVAAVRPVSDKEMVKQMSTLSSSVAGKFDTNLALKELCVYAVNYGVELMNSLNTDYTCQQMDLPQQLEHCFRSFTIFEA